MDLAGGGRTCHAGIRVARAASGPSGEDAAVRPPCYNRQCPQLSLTGRTNDHFGLGKAEQVDKLVVHWTDGTTTNVDVPSVNRVVEVRKQTPPAQ